MLWLLLEMRLCPLGNTNTIRAPRMVPALIDHCHGRIGRSFNSLKCNVFIAAPHSLTPTRLFINAEKALNYRGLFSDIRSMPSALPSLE